MTNSDPNVAQIKKTYIPFCWKIEVVPTFKEYRQSVKLVQIIPIDFVAHRDPVESTESVRLYMQMEANKK